MGYRRMEPRDLWELYRRWHDGQSISRIARSEGRDRKTVRHYVAELERLGLQRTDERLDTDAFIERTSGILPEQTARAMPAREQLERHRDEIVELVGRSKDPLIAKSAFEVVTKQHGLDVSYGTFKRFARDERLGAVARRQMIRIELPPGIETQIDYGKVGRLYDPLMGRERVVWAFGAVLSCSRLPFVQYVFSQDQTSFAGSVVDMVHFYGGATEIISIDNLKAGVIKPDLWDPKINRALSDAAAHYGTFIDPCRVARATDKGKIERLMPVMRQLFRMLKELHPSTDRAELNEHALQWCRNDYGRREHGTTGLAPMDVFEQEERARLKPLPPERFEVPVWRSVTVHSGDQFVTFQRMYFSMPPHLRGRTLWACYTAPILRFYDGETLVRQYVVRSGQMRYWQPEDFPPEVERMMDGGYPAWLLEQATAFGTAARAFIAGLLTPHAYLNARRARAIIDIMKAHYHSAYFDDVCERARRHSVVIPKTFRHMMERAAGAEHMTRSVFVSERGEQMIRDIGYYIN